MLLSMTIVCMKLEKAGPNQTLDIERTRLYKTDGPTERQTGAKQYTPSSSKGCVMTASGKILFSSVDNVLVYKTLNCHPGSHLGCNSLYLSYALLEISYL